ncbi:MAG: 16S rRNA (cytosine(967)-C(5))-methyltransferase RsmB [Sporolactobacillus sp.]
MSRPNAREQALDLLFLILEKGAYSPLALNDALSKNTWSAADRALITTLVYGTMQRKMTLDYVLSCFVAKEKRLDNWVHLLLLLSIYQKMYLDRIPDHALVNEAVEIAKRRGHRGISNFVNGVLRRLIREGVPSLDAITSEERREAICSSHPQWLLRLWRGQWDAQTARRIAAADNEPPQTYVRVNRLRTDRETIISKLNEAGFTAAAGELSADCLVVEHAAGNLAASPFFISGDLTIQDQSSMLVADAVDPQPHEHVLDACAGPGGKTTHLAERMAGVGQITALDLHPHKTQLIDQAAQRLGVAACIHTQTCDAREAGAIFPSQSFDRVLLDVPCSGFGVIRRKPEIRYEKQEADIAQLACIQKAILREAAPLVRMGGLLVYSTCTISRMENDRQIRDFLATHPEFEPDSKFAARMPVTVQPLINLQLASLQLMPYMFATDGFFIACLRRRQE